MLVVLVRSIDRDLTTSSLVDYGESGYFWAHNASLMSGGPGISI